MVAYIMPSRDQRLGSNIILYFFFLKINGARAAETAFGKAKSRISSPKKDARDALRRAKEQESIASKLAKEEETQKTIDEFSTQPIIYSDPGSK